MEKINNHVFTPNLDKVFKMKDICQAHDYIETRKHKGKVVLVF